MSPFDPMISFLWFILTLLAFWVLVPLILSLMNGAWCDITGVGFSFQPGLILVFAVETSGGKDIHSFMLIRRIFTENMLLQMR